MGRKRTAVIGMMIVCLAWTTGHAMAQGSLTPTGAPAPTMKTLDQVEPRIPISSLPYEITAPGSYYVTANLTGVSGQSGITINADNVTLDLNGFTLTGGIGTGSGIISTKQRIRIRNGNICNWAGHGIWLATSNFACIEHVIIYSNTVYGIIANEHTVINNCQAYNNGDAGFKVGNNSKVSDSVSSANEEDGIELASSCLVSDCICRNNGDDGISGIDLNNITDCVVSSNAFGIYLTGNNNMIKQSSAVSNSGFGISALADTRVADCVASGNGGHGVIVESRSVVERCTINKNATHGILVNSDSSVMNNTCIGNGANGSGAGISATSGNKIKNNVFQDADIGLYILGRDNTVEGNAVYGNTDNYNIATADGNQLNLLIYEIPETLDWSCSAKLAGTLICTNNGVNGITVAANDVTIDMDGHALIGPGTSSGAGIHQSVIYSNLRILNGKVSGWQGATGNKAGIRTWGKSTILTGLQVSSNFIGIVTGDSSKISDCLVNYNGSIGIRTYSGSKISACTVNNNNEGIITLDNCNISDCEIYYNADIGITVRTNCMISKCIVNNNLTNGISGGENNTVSKCNANHNGANGIKLSTYSSVSECTTHDNANTGIEIDNSGYVSKCLANNNSFWGIKVGEHCLVSDCIANDNTYDGIWLLRRSEVRNCVCTKNDLAGIYLYDHSGHSDGNRLEGNNIGIKAGGSYNFIVRNTAIWNETNYVISAGNNVGPIVIAPFCSAISGDTGGAGVGSTDPWANISIISQP